jgi:hypothetical protein
MAAAISYATMLAKKGQTNAVDLAEVFCAEARKRIEFNFANLFESSDDKAYRVVQSLMKGEYDWLQGELVEAVPSAQQIEEALRKLA